MNRPSLQVPVKYLDYYDIDLQNAFADQARSDGLPALVALRQGPIVWLSWTHGAHACLKCFQFWRFDRLSETSPYDKRFQSRQDTAAEFCPPFVEPAALSYIEYSRKNAKGHECVRRINLQNGETTDHPLIRHDRCDRCSERYDGSAEDAAQDPRQTSIPTGQLRGLTLQQISQNILPGIVDQRLGPIRHIEHRLSSPILTVAEASTYAEDAYGLFQSGYGRTGVLVDDPIIAAIEAMERYAGMRPRGRREIVQGSFDQLRDRAIDPESFILHSQEQLKEPGFNLAEYAPDLMIDWVWAYSFRHAQPKLVPARLAYFGLSRGEAAKSDFVFEVSNGCAAGSTLLEAAIFGLLEVIERDAFLASWYSNRPITRIDSANCDDPSAKALLARLRSHDLIVDVFDIGVGLPGAAITVKIQNRSRRLGPSLAFAAAAHVTAGAALNSALLEAATMLEPTDPDLRRHNDKLGRQLLADPARVKTMQDHTLQCWPEEAVKLRSFNESEKAPVSWNEFDLSHTVATCNQHGVFAELLKGTMANCHDVLFIDQSFEPARHNGLNFAKILAPGLLPMTFGHAYRRISTDRLDRVPGVLVSASYRNEPHAFP